MWVESYSVLSCVVLCWQLLQSIPLRIGGKKDGKMERKKEGTKEGEICMFLFFYFFIYEA